MLMVHFGCMIRQLLDFGEANANDNGEHVDYRTKTRYISVGALEYVLEEFCKVISKEE
jgi:hypothetical protein